MVVFGEKGLYSDKVVVIRQTWVVFWQSGCNSGISGCTRAKLLYSGKKVVFGQKWLYSGKNVVFGQKWLHSCKRVVFGQKWLHSGKVVVFGNKWLYSGKRGCNREKMNVFG